MNINQDIVIIQQFIQIVNHPAHLKIQCCMSFISQRIAITNWETKKLHSYAQVVSCRLYQKNQKVYIFCWLYSNLDSLRTLHKYKHKTNSKSSTESLLSRAWTFYANIVEIALKNFLNSDSEHCFYTKLM